MAWHSNVIFDGKSTKTVWMKLWGYIINENPVIFNIITDKPTLVSNGLEPSGNKPLSEPMLTQIYVTIWCHLATICWSHPCIYDQHKLLLAPQIVNDSHIELKCQHPIMMSHNLTSTVILHCWQELFGTKQAIIHYLNQRWPSSWMPNIA